MKISNCKLKIMSYIFMFSFIIAIILLNLFYSFMSGFIIYEFMSYINKLFKKLSIKPFYKIIIILLVYIIILTIFFLIILTIKFALISNIKNFIYLIKEIDNVFIKIIDKMPNYVSEIIKSNIKNYKNKSIILTKINFLYIKYISEYFFYKIFTILIGSIIGVLIFLSKKPNTKKYLILELIKRIKIFSISFKNVLLGQIKVSLIKSFFIYIIILLFKIFNINLPFYKTIITLIFILGFIPIIGNLISSLILTFSFLSISLNYYIIVLVFLLLIYILEYILTVKIIGDKIKSKSWEILLAMLILQSLFGVEGLIVAPIYYSYLKSELKLNKLI